MRYTLDKTRPHPSIQGLYALLDEGKTTKAFASERAIIKDDVTIVGGVFHDGVFHDGEFYDGEFRGGVFHDGVFYDGVFHDGVFYDGEFCGGEFRGGVFFGGVFFGGVFRGGVFYDGVFRGGWLPLQIQGSRHFINIPDGKQIKIGCILESPEWWLENYEQVGKKEDYTQEQIREYKRYIDLATAIIDEAKQK